MMDIIKSEVYKVRKSRNTLVTSIIMLAIAAIGIGVYITMKILGGEYEKLFRGENVADIYASFSTSSFYFIFVAMFVGGVVSNEFTFGTVRQVVSRGTKREYITIGQFLALSAVIHIITIICSAITALAYGVLYGTNGADIQDFLVVFAGQAVVVWSFSAFSMLIAHITRSGGLAIGINLLIVLGGEVAVTVLAFLTKNNIFTDLWMSTLQQKSIDLTITMAERLKCWGILGAFGIVCVVISVIIFRKRDVC